MQSLLNHLNYEWYLLLLHMYVCTRYTQMYWYTYRFIICDVVHILCTYNVISNDILIGNLIRLDTCTEFTPEIYI